MASAKLDFWKISNGFLSRDQFWSSIWMDSNWKKAHLKYSLPLWVQQLLHLHKLLVTSRAIKIEFSDVSNVSFVCVFSVHYDQVFVIFMYFLSFWHLGKNESKCDLTMKEQKNVKKVILFFSLLKIVSMLLTLLFYSNLHRQHIYITKEV